MGAQSALSQIASYSRLVVQCHVITMNPRRRCLGAYSTLSLHAAMMTRSTVLASTKLGRGETRPGSRVVVVVALLDVNLRKKKLPQNLRKQLSQLDRER